MINEIFEWLATLFTILGVVLISSKKQINARFRMYAFVMMIIGNLLFLIWSLLVSAFGVALMEIIILLFNIRGIYNNTGIDKAREVIRK